MDITTLEAKRAEIQKDIENTLVQLHRYEGAILLLNEQISNLQTAKDASEVSEELKQGE